MGPKHDTRNGRPVHPACPAQSGAHRYEIPCACNKLWDGWDGTDADLDKLIAAAEANDKRGRAIATPVDEVADEATSSKFTRRVWEGFWSNAENLRCVRGKSFQNGDIDKRRMTGLVWERAAEASK